ncbi:MAG: ATP-binding protein [Clostridia bacterium]|nr:ATP-binding protein [Clostridia bacterium]
MNISIFYEKKDKYKTIRELTYHIGNVGVDLKKNKENVQDRDIAQYSYDDAKYIRKEMQINNEDLYLLYIYINVYAKSPKELEIQINNVEGILESNGIETKRANFRQEQLFFSCLPTMQNEYDIKNASKRNVLTNGLVGTYPFVSSSIFDEEGIYVGNNIYNNSLVFIDKFNREKYKNGNMCVFGTSGAGKSFFTKLQIIRNWLIGIEQYVIDPEREYETVCRNLKGSLFKIGPSSNTYINIFDIRENTIEENKGYLAAKIQKLLGFLGLIFGELNEEEKAKLEEKLIETYKRKGITFDDKTLYKANKENRIQIKEIFKSSYEMPKIEDFYKTLQEDKEMKKYYTQLTPFVKGSLSYLNNYTNIELENKLIIADIYELGEENLKYGMYIFTELFWDKIKEDREKKKTIYLDEIWRLIGITSNKDVASFIYKIFKTIRKYSGSSVAITQDVSDLFSLENGIYGKSILNNSCIKTFFSLEEENICILEKYTNISEKEKIEIRSLKKGECLMFVDQNHILVKIDSSEEEKNII